MFNYYFVTSILSRVDVEISTYNNKVLFYFIFMQHPIFLPSFVILVLYKGSKIQVCYIIGQYF